MKSLGMKRSLLTGVEPFLPFPVLGICNHITQGQAGSATAKAAGCCLTITLSCDDQQQRYQSRSNPSCKSKHLTSVHISFTFSKIMLQCLSNAFTLPRSFRLFLQLINTCKGITHIRWRGAPG